MDSVRQFLANLADEKKIALSEASKAIGKNHAYLQQFIKRSVPAKLPEDVRHALAEYLKIDERRLRPTGAAPPVSPEPTPEPEPAPNEVTFAGPAFIPRLGPLDVDVLGNAVGGDKGDFIMNGPVIGQVRRPQTLAGQRVFAVYVNGSSMEPRYFPGELVYASRTKPAAIGDFVIVEMNPIVDGDETPGFIKRLIGQTAKAWICEQYNPPKKIEYLKREVRHVYRVIPYNEVNGV